LTLRELAGRMLFAGWQADGADPADARTVNAHARLLLADIGVGGLIVFDRNLGAPAEIARLTLDLEEAAGRRLLLGIDQEGGRVCRLRLPGLTFCSARRLGELDDPAVTRAVARALGEQLAALGLNLDFAPVLDVNSNPHNPVIGDRSYGATPEQVTRHGLAALAGFREGGVLPVVKHFPGHGDTGVDSHLALPVQPADRERLDRVELPPFRAAIEAGAPVVMSSHILFPALDPDLPATLSPRFLTGLLREELGFTGLIVTDCLEMQGIAARWTPEEAAVLAVSAGADLLVVCHTAATQLRMRDALVAAVRGGRLAESRLRESVARAEAALGQVPGVPRRPETVGAAAYLKLEAGLAA
jgi:beta-N-acetylhexosaminidase